MISSGLINNAGIIPQFTSVRVTVVHPGAIATKIMKNSGLNQQQDQDQINSPKILTAPKAARIIIRAMGMNKYRVTVGRDAAMLDMFYRLYPKWD